MRGRTKEIQKIEILLCNYVHNKLCLCIMYYHPVNNTS